jgi:hypothetical protein
MFNDGNYEVLAKSGKLRTRILKERHPCSPKANVPVCTKSQIIAYLDDDGDEIAIVHQYLQPDGTLGASGFPDPKRLLKDGILYVAWQGSQTIDM